MGEECEPFSVKGEYKRAHLPLTRFSLLKKKGDVTALHPVCARLYHRCSGVLSVGHCVQKQGAVCSNTRIHRVPPGVLQGCP